jgi:hypothetical protein
MGGQVFRGPNGHLSDMPTMNEAAGAADTASAWSSRLFQLR